MCNDPIDFSDLEGEEFVGKGKPSALRPSEPEPGLDPVVSAMTGGKGINAATTAKYEETCEACGGSGQFVSWAGRVVGECFKCKGKGKRYFRTDKATREKQREQARKRREKKAAESADAGERWLEEQCEGGVAWLVRTAERWELAADLLAKLRKYGELSPKQLAIITRGIERDRARDAERQRQQANAKDLDLTPLPSGTYAVPGGETRLKVRVNHVGKGKWAGWCFVDDGAEYGSRQKYGAQRPGKLYVGKVEDALEAILADPEEAMKQYGRITGTCGACGRKLEDEESVAYGIGPVCRKKFG